MIPYSTGDFLWTAIAMYSTIRNQIQEFSPIGNNDSAKENIPKFGVLRLIFV